MDRVLTTVTFSLTIWLSVAGCGSASQQATSAQKAAAAKRSEKAHADLRATAAQEQIKRDRDAADLALFRRVTADATSKRTFEDMLRRSLLIDGERRMITSYVSAPDGRITRVIAIGVGSDTNDYSYEAKKVGIIYDPTSQTQLEYDPITGTFTDHETALAGRSRINAARLQREAEQRAQAETRSAQLEADQRAQAAARRAQRAAERRAKWDEIDEDGFSRAIPKILIAVISNNVANNAKGDDFKTVLKIGAAVLARDAAIKSAIPDVFPNMEEDQVEVMTRVIGLYADGRLTVKDFAQETIKDKIIAALSEEDENLGRSAKVIDFIADVFHRVDEKKQTSK